GRRRGGAARADPRRRRARRARGRTGGERGADPRGARARPRRCRGDVPPPGHRGGGGGGDAAPALPACGRPRRRDLQPRARLRPAPRAARHGRRARPRRRPDRERACARAGRGDRARAGRGRALRRAARPDERARRARPHGRAGVPGGDRGGGRRRPRGGRRARDPGRRRELGAGLGGGGLHLRRRRLGRGPARDRGAGGRLGACSPVTPARGSILLLGPMEPLVAEQLSPFGEVVELDPDDGAALALALPDAVAVAARASARVDAALIEAAPALRVIGRSGVGVDRVDVAAATRRGIPVVIAPTAGTNAVAEGALALILHLVKRLGRLTRLVREGGWAAREELAPGDLDGATLGIVGYGRIGRRLAELASALGMRVLAHDPYA